MRKIFIVWEDVDDYPEMGGGEYLEKVFSEKENAERYCAELNNKKHQKNTSYYVDEVEVF